MEEIVGEYIIKIVQGNDVTASKYLNEYYRLRYEQMILDYNPKSNNVDKIDKDEYDNYCSHLLLIDNTKDIVVGGYRILINNEKNMRFITENEFDISYIKDKKIMEVGRAIIDENYRKGLGVSLLWKYLIRFALRNKCDYVIGTASFHGIDIKKYEQSFVYLKDNYISDLDCFAINDVIKFDSILKSNSSDIKLPVLVKGYLSLGAKIGRDIYVDRWFNSLDVLILLEIDKINKRYLNRYLRD